MPDPLNHPHFTYSYASGSFGLISSVTGPVHTVQNTWDTDRNALLRKENQVAANEFSSYQYFLNDIGQRIGMIKAGSALGGSDGALSYQYNHSGEVVTAKRGPNAQFPAIGGGGNPSWNYSYDAIGNRTSVATISSGIEVVEGGAYTANAQNQYTAIASVNPQYDNDGNATSYPLPNDSSANATLTWDGENRLVSVSLPGGGAFVSYEYDYLGRRIARTSGSKTTSYLYDGWNCVSAYEANADTGAFTNNRYLWGLDLSGSMQGAGGVGGLLMTVHGHRESLEGEITRESFYPAYDGNGNITEYLNSSGQTEARFFYDPFGNTYADTDAEGKFDYRFSTKPKDAATGLYYYGYRYYDPVTGRWPSRDPIGERGGLNSYVFIGNDSIGSLDLLGLVDVNPNNVAWLQFAKRKEYTGGGLHVRLGDGRQEFLPVYIDGVLCKCIRYEMIDAYVSSTRTYDWLISERAVHSPTHSWSLLDARISAGLAIGGAVAKGKKLKGRGALIATRVLGPIGAGIMAGQSADAAYQREIDANYGQGGNRIRRESGGSEATSISSYFIVHENREEVHIDYCERYSGTHNGFSVYYTDSSGATLKQKAIDMYNAQSGGS